MKYQCKQEKQDLQYTEISSIFISHSYLTRREKVWRQWIEMKKIFWGSSNKNCDYKISKKEGWQHQESMHNVSSNLHTNFLDRYVQLICPINTDKLMLNDWSNIKTMPSSSVFQMFRKLIPWVNNILRSNRSKIEYWTKKLVEKKKVVMALQIKSARMHLRNINNKSCG